MASFLTRKLELKRKMYVSAIELLGIIPNNLIRHRTKKIIAEIIQKLS